MIQSEKATNIWWNYKPRKKMKWSVVKKAIKMLFNDCKAEDKLIRRR